MSDTTADKVKFGVKNGYWAPIEDEATNKFGTPVRMPGLVAISLDPQGESTPFYADSVVYFRTTSNNGYQGDIEVAYFLPDFLKYAFQYSEGTTSKVLTENASKLSKPFALLFEEEGDVTGTKFAMYKCTATRPKRTFKTRENSINPTTQTMSVSFEPLPDGDIFSMTQPETPADVVNNWYKAVYKETTAAAAQAN